MRFIVVGLLFLLSTSAVAAPKTLQVGFVLDGESRDSLQSVDRYTSALQEIHSDEEVLLEFSTKYNFSADYTMNGVGRALDLALKDREIDLVIMTGSIGAKVASNIGQSRKGLSKPVFAPEVFDATLQGIGIDRKSNQSNIRNFNYISVPHIIENDLRAFTNVVAFHHIGVIIDESLIQTFDVDVREYIDKRSAMIRKVTILPISTSGDKFLADYGARPADFQGLYLTTLSQMTEESEAILIQGLKKAKLPIFSMKGPKDVKQGALASLTPKNVEALIDARLRENIIRLCAGERIDKLPVLVNVEGSLNINLDTAEYLSVWPEWDVLAEAEIIGGKEVKALTISDVIQLSKMNNPKVAIGQLDQLITAQEILRTRSEYLPQLEAKMSGVFIDHDRRVQPLELNNQHDVQVGIQLKQQLWSYEDLVQIKIKETEHAAVNIDMELLQQQVTEDAALSFLRLVEFQAIVKVYQQHFSLIRSQLDLARRLDEHGDVARMEAIFSQTKEEMLQAKSNAMEMEVLLREVLSTEVLIGRPSQRLLPEEERFLSYLHDPRTFEEVLVVLVELASLKNIEIEQGVLAERLKVEELKAGKISYYSPEVEVTAALSHHLYRSRVNFYENLNSYNSLVDQLEGADDLALNADIYNINVPEERDDLDWFVGMEMSLPIFTGLDRRARVEQAKASLLQQQEKNTLSNVSLSFELHRSLLRVNSLYRSIQISHQTVLRSTEALEEVSKQYFDGDVLLSELRDSSDIALQAALKEEMLKGLFRRTLFSLMSTIGIQDFYTVPDAQEILFSSLEQHFIKKGFPLPETSSLYGQHL